MFEDAWSGVYTRGGTQENELSHERGVVQYMWEEILLREEAYSWEGCTHTYTKGKPTPGATYGEDYTVGRYLHNGNSRKRHCYQLLIITFHVILNVDLGQCYSRWQFR